MSVLRGAWERWCARDRGLHRTFKKEIRQAPVTTTIELTLWPALMGLLALAFQSWVLFLLGMSIILAGLTVVPFLQDIRTEMVVRNGSNRAA